MKKYLITMRNELGDYVVRCIEAQSQKEALAIYAEQTKSWRHCCYSVLSISELDADVEISDLTNEY